MRSEWWGWKLTIGSRTPQDHLRAFDFDEIAVVIEPEVEFVFVVFLLDVEDLPVADCYAAGHLDFRPERLGVRPLDCDLVIFQINLQCPAIFRFELDLRVRQRRDYND